VTDPPRRRFRVWKFAAVLLGVPVLLAGILWGWIKVVELRKRGAVERRMAELGAAADSARLPILAETVAGNRWAGYADALTLTAGSRKPGELRQIKGILDGDPQWSAVSGREEAARLLSEFKGAQEALCRGARRTTAQGPVPEFYSETVVVLASVVRNQAGVLSKDRPDEAMDLLLSLLQFGADLDAAELPSATDPIEIGLDGLHTLLPWISAGQRGALERALHQLEGSLSLGRLLKKDLRWLGSEVLSPNPETLRFFNDKSWKTAKADWRYGFSMNHLLVDSFVWVDRWVREAETAEQLPYAEARARLLVVRGEVESCPNRIAVTLGTFQRAWERSYRGSLAHLRLLRTACGAPGLADPFGTVIRTADLGDFVRIWSIGPDGVDDQGEGDWKLENRDLVINVLRE
jgi:hypothetical protein